MLTLFVFAPPYVRASAKDKGAVCLWHVNDERPWGVVSLSFRASGRASLGLSLSLLPHRKTMGLGLSFSKIQKVIQPTPALRQRPRPICDRIA